VQQKLRQLDLSRGYVLIIFFYVGIQLSMLRKAPPNFHYLIWLGRPVRKKRSIFQNP